MKTTVTPDASVASPRSIEDALESGFLPSDPTYRKTGKFADEQPPARVPEKTDEEEQLEYEQELEQQNNEADGNEGEQDQEEHEEQDPAASGEQDGESAAASQAAQPQKKPGKNRWAKLSRENRELREQLARARGQQPTATRDTSQASQPAAAAATTPKGRPEPKIDDVDPQTKQPKYEDYEAFDRDRRKWDREQAVLEVQEANAKAERERQARQIQDNATRVWNERVTEAAKALPDFKEVALDTTLPVKAGSVLDVFLLESEVGPQLLYHLGKNPGEFERIQGTPTYDANGLITGFTGGMNPLAQVRALTLLEQKVSGSSSSSTSASSSARPVSQAPRPPHQSSGKGTVPKDAVEEAVKHKNQNDYARSQNERDPRLLAVRRARKSTA